jgi:hypothetical protein
VKAHFNFADLLYQTLAFFSAGQACSQQSEALALSLEPGFEG